MKNDDNVMFICGCYPKDNEKDFYINSYVMPQNAANVLSWHIIDGMTVNIGDNLTVVTAPFIGYYPKQYKKLIIENRRWSLNSSTEKRHLQIGFINIKGLETFIKSEKIYREAIKWYKESKKNRTFLIYSHYAGFMRAAGKLKRKFKDIHISVIVTDMNEKDYRPDLQGIYGKLKSIPRNIMIRTTYKNLKYIDSFVLLAENMKDHLEVGDRPYTVVEGVAKIASELPNNIDLDSNSNSEFKVVYTGTLHKRYGLLNLVEAFNYIEDISCKLFICGDGDGRNEIEKISKVNPQINYLGVLEHSEAVKLQQSANLLVNPMPEFGIHTELSFPSKTMEYMAAAKPVACFKVKGIPDEYDSYLSYFKENSPLSIAHKILELKELGDEKLKTMGEENRTFVVKFKNAKVQTAKIVNLILG
ncbi:glycosyltransferase family 4 protein [Neobacillus sp. SAB-20_R2A]|uniref:glycosyltransferase family 4 protein n=1 Tax=Neobacillus sp. SAB-20_R2A TaxID=3120519 RepID=UPI003C6E97DC